MSLQRPAFEWHADNEKLCIHGSPEALRDLAQHLLKLADATPSGAFEHEHLMSPEWGGEELSETAQAPDSKLVHHVKLYCWNR